MFFQENQSGDWFETDFELYHCIFAREHYHDSLFHLYQIDKAGYLDRAVVKRRAEYLAGRFCAAQALKKWGIYVRHIGRGEHGEPLWPEGMIGSISHCHNRAVALVGDATGKIGVGIDVEDEISHEVISNVLAQTLDEHEIALISADSARFQACFTLFFSLKESFFKAAYGNVGHYFGFEAISIFKIDFVNQSMDFVLKETLSPQLVKGKTARGYFRVLPERQYVTVVELTACSATFDE
ncbi:4'-phosphopantetheinyl transferase family protein [Dickeya solani]|uniref:Enterobactin synthase component D n=1 Tax=Dickeya solani TaxID=1089444 RepID=A0AAX4F2N2_9GAMM|nr:4'-phosphopantetheinyl transferase superfamily protein [Dickeya solani]WOA53279.1 4'-phosphopantetheinyl transferase superfamily protein [Dickeya solani]